MALVTVVAVQLDALLVELSAAAMVELDAGLVVELSATAMVKLSAAAMVELDAGLVVELNAAATAVKLDDTFDALVEVEARAVEATAVTDEWV